MCEREREREREKERERERKREKEREREREREINSGGLSEVYVSCVKLHLERHVLGLF